MKNLLSAKGIEAPLIGKSQEVTDLFWLLARSYSGPTKKEHRKAVARLKELGEWEVLRHSYDVPVAGIEEYESMKAF